MVYVRVFGGRKGSMGDFGRPERVYGRFRAAGKSLWVIFRQLETVYGRFFGGRKSV